MTDQIIYDLNGNFQCIVHVNLDGSQTSFGPGTGLWSDYVAQNGVPPATGTPTNKPARIPLPYLTTYNALKALNGTQQNQVLGAVCSFVLVNNPQLAAAINAQFSLNLPFDQANP